MVRRDRAGALLATGPLDVTEVAEGVHACRTALVNWTLVRDTRGVLVVDAGFPGQRDAMLASLRAVGAGPDDVAAVLLTHAHVDHLGTAPMLAAEYDVPVYCHAGEVAHARGERVERVATGDVVARLWRPAWLAWAAAVARAGGLAHATIPGIAPLTAEVAARLPGDPRAVPTPGHTAGHCSYVVAGRVLLAGDALVTGHPVASGTGPQLLPAVFDHDRGLARRSLAALAELDTDVLVPGHGAVARGPIRDMVAAALDH